jgi:pimeloyl-ACP methyl ester carboxylesterase
MGNKLNKIVFFPPHRPHQQEEYENDIFIQSHSLKNNQVQIKTLIQSESYPYLIISHGNAEDIYSVYDWVYNIFSKQCKINFVMYEYTGYGFNQQNLEPSEKSCYDDIETVYFYLTETLKIPSKKIILFGRSVGSGPSCYLAEKYDVGGLILNSGFLSVFRVVIKLRFTFFGDIFPNVDRIKNIKCPVCVIHSVKDEVVPFYHAKKMYMLAKNKFEPLFIDGTSHNNIDVLSNHVYVHMNKFFRFLEEKENNGNNYENNDEINNENIEINDNNIENEEKE